MALVAGMAVGRLHEGRLLPPGIRGHRNELLECRMAV
jgi:hypothetical protein